LKEFKTEREAVDKISETLDRSKKIFAFAPDTENPIHHVRIGQGSYTAVTIGCWNEQDTMHEEWLFYDDYTFIKQQEENSE